MFVQVSHGPCLYDDMVPVDRCNLPPPVIYSIQEETLKDVTSRQLEDGEKSYI